MEAYGRKGQLDNTSLAASSGSQQCPGLYPGTSDPSTYQGVIRAPPPPPPAKFFPDFSQGWSVEVQPHKRTGTFAGSHDTYALGGAEGVRDKPITQALAHSG